MGNLSFKPWTEMWEVVQKDYVRDAGTDSALESKYKGAINSAYANFLSQILDEKYLRKEALVTTATDYSTGTVTIAAAASGPTGSATALWTSANSNNKLFRIAGYNEVFRVTYASATSVTFQNSQTWIEDAVTSATSYTLWQDRYALASDFRRMISDRYGNGQVVYYWRNNGKVFLDPLTDEQFELETTNQPGTPGQYAVKWVSGVPYLYVTPPDTDTRVLWYAYIPDLSYLTEYTTGTASCSAADTAVTGVGTAWSTYYSSSKTYYLRFDDDGVGSDSVWYLISTAGGATSITLSSAYGGTAKSGAAYTISEVSLLPKVFDDAIMLRAAMITDPDGKKWNDLFGSLISTHLSVDAKRIIGQQMNFSWQDWRR